MAKRKKTVRRKSKKLSWLVLLAAFVVTAAAILWLKLSQDNPPAKPLSRAVFELAEAQVRDLKPPPTQAALEYAYLASVYNDGLLEGGQRGALYTSKQMLNQLYPAAVAANEQ